MTNTDKIKQIPITSYLASIGIKPTKEKDDKATYIATWRGDKNPSVSVDKYQNVWIDFGADEKGGSVIDLVMTIEGCGISEACRRLENGSFSFAAVPLDIPKKQPETEIVKVIPLYSYVLKNYLASRGISLEIAQKYCSEIWYMENGKQYFGIGFKNDAGGYAVRNPLIKRNVGKSDITTIEGSTDEILIFEGFMDYLSVYQRFDYPSASVVVLNSTTNTNKIEPQLSNYKSVKLLLDNDPSGSEKVERLTEKYPNCKDCRGWYAGYKDINDYLNGKKQTL